MSIQEYVGVMTILAFALIGAAISIPIAAAGLYRILRQLYEHTEEKTQGGEANFIG